MLRRGYNILWLNFAALDASKAMTSLILSGKRNTTKGYTRSF